jgi:Xaa-Pro aminopeptidase
MSEARVIKTRDEITLLNTSAMMVDAAYDELYRAMKPGMSENQAVGLVSKVLYDLGSEYVEAVNAISGERCNPHPHVFSDRVLRPGDPVYYDILHSYMGYRTCYYRCFTIGYASHAMNDAYKRCREYLDAAIELVRPGRSTAEIAAVWPRALEFGFPNEEACFALQYGHGIGLAIWEEPVISRLVSFEHPTEIKPGMVFALETFWPSTDGWSAARIEEEIVVTEKGHEVITRFPAEELLVAGRHYFTVDGPLPSAPGRDSCGGTYRGAGRATRRLSRDSPHDDIDAVERSSGGGWRARGQFHAGCGGGDRQTVGMAGLLSIRLDA